MSHLSDRDLPGKMAVKGMNGHEGTFRNRYMEVRFSRWEWDKIREKGKQKGYEPHRKGLPRHKGLSAYVREVVLLALDIH